jgi:predicted permease
VFSLVDAVLLKPFPYVESDRLVLLWGSKRENVTRGLSGPNLADLRHQAHTLQDVDAFLGGMRAVIESESAEPVNGACVGARAFAILGVRPMLGRPFVSADQRPGAPAVVVISHSLWQVHFGSSAEVLGETIRLNDNQYEVVGVMPAGFFFPDTDSRFWIPVPCGLKGFNERAVPLVHGVARIRSGISVTDAQKDIDDVTRRLALAYPDANSRLTIGVFPFRNVVVRRFEDALLLLCAAVGIVVLIACANVAHLQVARGIERQGELAVRAACGASRHDIARQLLTENCALSGLAAAVGLSLAFAWIPLVKALALWDIPRLNAATVDLRVLSITALTSLIAAFVSGAWPAWAGSLVHPEGIVKSMAATSAASVRGFARTALATSEIAAAMVLLVVAGLVVRSFVELSTSNWGFDPDNLLLLSIKVPPDLKGDVELVTDWTETVVHQLNASPQVVRASASTSVPIRWTSWKSTPLAIEGRVVTDNWSPATWVVSPGYFSALGIPVLDGREFGANDGRGAPPHVLVSHALAQKLWPGESAVGRHLELLELKTENGQPLPEFLARFNRGDRSAYYDPRFLQPVENKSWQVIGVVADVRMFGLELSPTPALYLDHRQNPRSRIWQPLMSTVEMKFVVRSRGAAMAVADHAKSVILSVNHRASIAEVVWMADLVGESIGGRGSRKLTVLICGAFAALALAFSMVGIYGLVTYTVTQRVREIGIRRALGANGASVLLVVGRETARVLMIGLAVGGLAAAALARVLRSQLFGVTSTDSLTYAAAGILLSMCAILAALAPLRRALSVTPAELLRV